MVDVGKVEANRMRTKNVYGTVLSADMRLAENCC